MPGQLYVVPPGAVAPNEVQCVACAHRCRIQDGKSGICRMRFNRGGNLLVPSGYASSIACDPIEKKPFFHLLAGEDALSFGMLGCNLHCPFCQNWTISQTLRDPEALAAPRTCSADELVATALRMRAAVVTSTYNEPLVTTEWAVAVFRKAKEHGLVTGYVSNGFASGDVLDYLGPWLDAMNVDLKCFTDDGYRHLGGRLQPVLDTIRRLWDMGKWIEVITLLVPGFNDSDAELRGIAQFLVSVSPDIPWHISAYHADYKMLTGPPRTPVDRLTKAIAIGKSAGIRYVYAGNVHGIGEHENTHCHHCGLLLVEREGFSVRRNAVTAGSCPDCGTVIPGRWTVPETAG